MPDVALHNVLEGGPKRRLCPAYEEGKELAMDGLLALRASHGHSGPNDNENEALHVEGVPPDGGRATGGEPEVPPLLPHFTKRKYIVRENGIAHVGLWSAKATEEAGMGTGRRNPVSGRHDIMLAHADPMEKGDLRKPMEGVKSGSGSCVFVKTGELMAAGAKIFLSLQYCRHVVWLTPGLGGRIPKRFLLQSFWDARRQAMVPFDEGDEEEETFPPEAWYGEGRRVYPVLT